MSARFVGLFLFVAAFPALAAQPADDKPSVFFSPVSSKATPEQKTASFVPRANHEAAYYLYLTYPVRNYKPEDEEAKTFGELKVVLTSDEAGRRVLADAVVKNVKPNVTRSVALSSKQTVTEKAPADKATADKTPPVSANAYSGRKVYLWLYNAATDKLIHDSPEALDIDVLLPSELLKVEKPEINASTKSLRLKISSKHPDDKDDKLLLDPARVHLDFRPNTNLFPSLEPQSLGQGTYSGEVGHEGSLVLSAQQLKFRDRNERGVLGLTVDGVTGMFLFNVNLNATDAPETRRILLSVPRYAIPGLPGATETKIDATIDVFGDVRGDEPKLTMSGNESVNILPRAVQTPRDEKFSLRIGSEGEVVVGSTVRNWVVPIRTNGLYGERTLALKIGDQSSVQPVTFDDTKPVNVRIVNVPEIYVRQKDVNELTLYAVGEDPESDIQSVVFFVKDPPVAGKKPEPGTVAEGTKVFFNRKTWAGKLTLPATLGTVEVGVRFTNNVGLTTDAYATIRFVDPKVETPKPKPTTGKIEGVVADGNDHAIPQAAVDLLDPDGKKISSASADNDGKFVFKDVAPGKYKIRGESTKGYKLRGADKQIIEVVAGETSKSQVVVHR